MKKIGWRTQINLNKLENALNKNLSFIKNIEVRIREIIDPGIKRMELESEKFKTSSLKWSF